MNRRLIFLSLFGLFALTGSENIRSWEKKTPVYEVLFELGEQKPAHYIEQPDSALIQHGWNIVHLGKTDDPEGRDKGYVSRFYVCTSCHNTVREDPDLTTIDQDARLRWAGKKQIGYLQSSTLWGIVNRETWYNDDYVKKYGDLVLKANESLIESTQLCATVCSQGRRLTDWEMDAVLSYYWSLQLKLSDLDISESEWSVLPELERDSAKNLIKSKYLLKSPATFVDPPKDKMKGYDEQGRPEMGKIIFERGCQHCHRPNGESDVVLNDSKATYRWLNRHKLDNSKLSIYEIIRHGTYSEAGHREYMPHYTLEKMSNRQVEDLRAFIESKLD